MRKTAGLIGIAIVVLVVVYFIGYWPARQQRVAAEARVATAESALAAAEQRVRIGELLGQLLTVKDLARRQDYGQALQQSTTFFDRLRTETSAAAGALQQGLSEVLAERDAVTAALAKGDPAVLDAIERSEHRLRRTLGYSTPPASPQP